MKTGRLVTKTEFEKAAALGVDLRQKGLGGIKRPFLKRKIVNSMHSVF